MLEREREEKWKKIEALRDELLKEGVAGGGQSSSKSPPAREDGSVTPTNPEEDSEGDNGKKEPDTKETAEDSESNT